MIEEFMLAANISVAEKILKHFPLCSLLRYILFNFLSCHIPDQVEVVHIQRYWKSPWNHTVSIKMNRVSEDLPTICQLICDLSFQPFKVICNHTILNITSWSKPEVEFQNYHDCHNRP